MEIKEFIKEVIGDITDAVIEIDTTYVCFWYAKKFDWRQLSVLGVLFYSIPQKSYICYDNRPSTLPET
jgi:hypothetical protein